ncbi:DUF4145 domain-containing protein [Burkholderia cepacia]|uniref:DUF4145 domain-containing protein n=1 Tax=Burkholderia cepacia TaxID=292 RepID=UPI0007C6D170|nr:DUF4145 domain-containing protein [Burkholderia cepacia]
MSYPTSFSSTVPENEHTQLLCADCRVVTRHKVLAKVESTYQEWVSDHNSVDTWLTHEIVVCGGCGDISVKKSTQFSEDWDVDDHGNPYYRVDIDIYPPRSNVGNNLRTEKGLPESIINIYLESCRAFDLELYVMAGFGLRAIVETICKDKEVGGKNLFEKIDGMEKAGLITADGTKVLHQLRNMGNDAAHELKAHSKRELTAAFEVVEYVLKGVYIIPEQAKLLPNRKVSDAV